MSNKNNSPLFVINAEQRARLKQSMVQIEEARVMSDKLKLLGLGTQELTDKLDWAEKVGKVLLQEG